MLHYIEKHAARLNAEAADGASPAKALIENVSRRSLLGGALTLSGFVLALKVLPADALEPLKPYPTGADAMPFKTVNDPHAFIAIASNGDVTIVAHRSEMGTGIRTSLPMVVADELEADWSRVTVLQAPGDEPKYGNQDTDGSRSMRHFIQPMRQCGAAMRQMLVAAAAAKWGVDAKLCRAKQNNVFLLDDKGNEVGKSLGYGELAEAAMALPVPKVEDLLFKTPAEFALMQKGKVKITDLHNITVGKAVYGGDLRLPGMKFAVVLRPDVLGGKVKSFDSTAALKVPGVEKVFEIKGVDTIPYKFGQLGGIAVVANTTYAALAGRNALKVEWDNGPNASYNTDAYTKEMSETASKPGKVIRNEGDFDAAFASAKDTFVGEYHSHHLAQAPMEPLVTIARIKDGKAEIWAPVQSPYGAREDVSKALKLPMENVTVHVTLLGGGFGRKSNWDYILEAALVSEKIGGEPVLLQWTREDDLRHAFYHTTAVERIEMAIDDKGKVTGWRHRTVAPSIVSTFAPDTGYQFPIEYGMGFVDIPFAIPNFRCENGQAFTHTRIGWFRSVSNIHRAFATQSAVCEVAYKLGRDPKDFLLEIIGPDRKIDLKKSGFPEDFWNYGEPYESYPIDTVRLKNVIRLAAEKAGWGKKLPERQALGIAAHRSFASYVASVVHVAVDEDGTIRVPEVTSAVDCGFFVNPERIRSQMEGAAVMGMSNALYSAITFKNGAVEQSNYSDYFVTTMANYPKIVNTVIVEPQESSWHTGGIGEPGVPPFAPALANAIFAATGKRIRNLPMGETVS